MFAVLEEIENNLATLIPDSKEKPIRIPLSALPTPYQLGDVFKVEKKEHEWVVTVNDGMEKEKRLAANKSKRERLLGRSKNKPLD